ncbi:MAG TPA: hypothetical protein VF717_04435 [Pyrinomonadaceae bacterium]|jgi:hypothetical protein
MADDRAKNEATPKPKLSDMPDGAEEVNPANDSRSLDIGESGQFAPGGYYNQHGVAEADRLNLDDIDTSVGDDKS